MNALGYAAKLLFLRRIPGEKEGEYDERCEIKIFHLKERDTSVALQQAKEIGAKLEVNFFNTSGQAVYLVFKGVVDLVRIGDWWEEGQVWDDDCTFDATNAILSTPLPSDEVLLRNV